MNLDGSRLVCQVIISVYSNTLSYFEQVLLRTLQTSTMLLDS